MEELQQPPKKSGKGLITSIIVIIFIITALAYAMLRNGKKVVDDKITSTPDTTDQTENPIPPIVTTKYKDGTYESLGNYTSPGGAEQIDVTLMLKDDVVTEATVVSKASRPNSVKFQGKFISGFKLLVIGKNIDDVHLDKVSGSSLTPGGFNDALEKIKSQAKV